MKRYAVNKFIVSVDDVISAVLLELDDNHVLQLYRPLSVFQSEPASTEFVDGVATFALCDSEPMSWFAEHHHKSLSEIVAKSDNYGSNRTLWLWKGVDLSNLMLTDEVYITRL